MKKKKKKKDGEIAKPSVRKVRGWASAPGCRDALQAVLGSVSLTFWNGNRVCDICVLVCRGRDDLLLRRILTARCTCLHEGTEMHICVYFAEQNGKNNFFGCLVFVQL